MTHEDQSTCFEELLQLLSEHGFDGMGEAIQILMNEAMKLERAETLGAMPYQLQRPGRWSNLGQMRQGLLVPLDGSLVVARMDGEGRSREEVQTP